MELSKHDSIRLHVETNEVILYTKVSNHSNTPYVVMTYIPDTKCKARVKCSLGLLFLRYSHVGLDLGLTATKLGTSNMYTMDANAQSQL